MKTAFPDTFGGIARICTFAALILFSNVALGASKPRIVLLENSASKPRMQAVAPGVRGVLRSLNVTVDSVAPDVFPATQDEWEQMASEQARQAPGTLAVYGWNCVSETRCNLFLMETRHLGLVAVPIRISAPEEAADTSPLLANAITVAIRESVFGNLLIEMDRVAAEAERSYVFFKGADGAEEADSVVNEPQQAPVSRFRALFWLEGAYIGAFPFPDNGVVNGARWGAVACPIPHVAPSLHIGWMGMRDASNAVGSVASSMIPVEAAVRIVIPVGMSHISLAPTLRLDLSISSLRPEDEERDTAFDVALLLGGMTYWSVPLPKDRMELVFGAGLMATVIGTDIEIDDQIVLEKSPFSVVWTAGLGWSL